PGRPTGLEGSWRAWIILAPKWREEAAGDSQSSPVERNLSLSFWPRCGGEGCMLSKAFADPGLLDPAAFPEALSCSSSFDRLLHPEEGLSTTHRGYAGAAFRTEGFSHNCVSIQLAGRTRHMRKVGDHRGSGTAVAGKVFATAARTPVDWSWDEPAEMV